MYNCIRDLSSKLFVNVYIYSLILCLNLPFYKFLPLQIFYNFANQLHIKSHSFYFLMYAVYFSVINFNHIILTSLITL